MTALDLEYAAVRTFLRDIHELRHPSGTVYERGIFESAELEWQITLAQTGIGNAISAIETARALDCFRPDIAIFVGIAGGLESMQIGDVVAADYVYGYESAKYTETHQSRIKTFGSGYPLVQRARAVRRHEEWHKRISSNARPRAFVGPIASGEQVVAGRNTPTHQIIEVHCGDTYAVEMEGWGFLFAAHTNGDVPAIVIRGISDLTYDKTPENDEEHQPRAAEHAAAFTFELLATLEGSEAGQVKPFVPWQSRQRASPSYSPSELS
ncbi:5'-methylthioadenosine/S-adenosylhomocysteine nucleosidase [Micromonospora sp. NPDC049374]|uniref:5'-methylthioadenosine/S-adenosylhomocysteine nucleosidase family protein n=1 Tax=Micromonospora sp. NPDC049374 TaxID=3154352 RepID=UPI00341F9059